MSTPGWKVSDMPREQNGRQLLTSPERNRAAGPKWKWSSIVDMSGGENKVWYCKEHLCTGIWNIRSMSQGKLDVVKQKMARLDINFLGISELKLTEKGEINSDDHNMYYGRLESLRWNGVALIVNKRVQNVVLGSNLKNDIMISVCFQGKPFNITVIQIYATTYAKEAEVDQFYKNLQDLLQLTLKKILFIIEDWNWKVGSQELPRITGKFALGVQNEAEQSLTEFCQNNMLVIGKTFSHQPKR